MPSDYRGIWRQCETANFGFPPFFRKAPRKRSRPEWHRDAIRPFQRIGKPKALTGLCVYKRDVIDVVMSIIHYSIAGTAACIAAVAGVYVQVMISQPEAKDDGTETKEASFVGTKLPPIAVPIFSQTQKVGYCMMRVEYGDENLEPDERRIIVQRVTNELYIEFSATLEKNADAPAECASRVGKRTDKFKIYDAEFFERINLND